MATLALPPTTATLPAQEDLRTSEKPSADDSATDPSDIDSGWVFLGKSDVVPADQAAAAIDAAGHPHMIKHSSYQPHCISHAQIVSWFLPSPPSTHSFCSSNRPSNLQSMATLALPPTAATLPPQEDPRTSEKPSADDSAADPSDIDSGWVFLGKSDVVPADQAAAAIDAAGHRRLGFSPLPMLPIWVQMVLGGVVYTAVPFYKRTRQIEDKAIENVETALDVLERASEVTEKFAANVANSLPADGSLHKLAEELKYIAEEVDKDAHKAEVMIKKIEALSNKIDAAVEPVIENLEEEFKPNPASHAGSDTQK